MSHWTKKAGRRQSRRSFLRSKKRSGGTVRRKCGERSGLPKKNPKRDVNANPKPARILEVHNLLFLRGLSASIFGFRGCHSNIPSCLTAGNLFLPVSDKQFMAVGALYQDFVQVTDDEVVKLLRQSTSGHVI